MEEMKAGLTCPPVQLTQLSPYSILQNMDMTSSDLYIQNCKFKTGHDKLCQCHKDSQIYVLLN